MSVSRRNQWNSIDFLRPEERAIVMREEVLIKKLRTSLKRDATNSWARGQIDMHRARRYRLVNLGTQRAKAAAGKKDD
jgi:hypothetical protein